MVTSSAVLRWWGVFFYAKAYFNLTQVNEPITIFDGIQIGGPVSLVAGVLLIALGIREYFHGHSHGNNDVNHGHAHDPDHHHSHAHRQGHSHDHDHDDGGLISRLKGFIPFVDGHSHSRDDLDEAADRGFLGIAWFAFVLGFAHGLGSVILTTYSVGRSAVRPI